MTTEQLMMRLGFEAKQAELGLAKMKSELGAFAAEQKAAQKKASAERIMMSKQESAAIDEIARKADVEQAARNNRAAALWRQREAARVAATKAAEAEMAEIQMAAAKRVADATAASLAAGQAAVAANQAAIAGGSIPANMAGGAEKIAKNQMLAEFGEGATFAAGAGGAGYIFSKAGKLLGKRELDGKIIQIAEKAAIKEIEHGSGTMIKQEAFVLVRETLRRAGLSRIMASAMRLLGLIGDAAMYYAAIPVATIGAVWETLPRLFRGTKNWGATFGDVISANKGISWWDATKMFFGGSGKGVQTEETDAKQKETAEMLKQRISLMRRNGIISDSYSRRLENDLAKPTQQSLIEAFNVTNPLMSQLKKAQVDMHETEIWREQQKTASDRYNFDLIQQHILLEKISQSKLRSTNYDKLMNDLAKTNLNIAKDQVEMAKEKADADKKIADQEKGLAEKIVANEMKLTQAGREYPSIANLAGRGFVNRLDALYGKGGRFDLGLGNGPLAGIAQDYLLEQKRQIWNRTYGHGAAADKNAANMMRDLGRLAQFGAVSPEQSMLLTAQNTRKMLDQLFKLAGTVKGNQLITVARLEDPK